MHEQLTVMHVYSLICIVEVLLPAVSDANSVRAKGGLPTARQTHSGIHDERQGLFPWSDIEAVELCTGPLTRERMNIIF